MSEQKVRLVRDIAAAPQAVFEAWLDPIAMGEFMKPAPGVTVCDVRVDATVGGAFSLTMMAGDTPIRIRGAYRRIERFSTLEFSWLSSRTRDDSVVVLTFDAIDDDHTRLTLEHVGFADAAARDDHDGGWGAIVTHLASMVA